MTDRPLEDLAERRERERQAADKSYNDALTCVDRAISPPPTLPPPPRAYDDKQMATLNRQWNILPDGAPPLDRSLKGRLRTFVWRLVGPALERQNQFNSALVDHVNRNVAAHGETERAMAAHVDAVRQEFAALARFQSLLVQYLQTITAYVDTRDRASGGVDVRERVSLVEQRMVALTRAVESKGVPASATVSGSGAPFTGDLDSQIYVGFEDRFRGSQRDIGSRAESYLPILAGATDVLDVGCGRGELLDRLRERGIRARGIDVNAAMVDVCRARGLDVEQADAVGYLDRQPDGSIGALIAIQVVEHFDPVYLLRFLETAYRSMRPDAPLVLETLNPACWMAFFEAYIRDLTHQRPLHPDTLKYLVEATGFTSVNVEFRAPVRDTDRLDRVAGSAASAAANPELSAVIAALNAHADKLNARLFSSLDYAIVARR